MAKRKPTGRKPERLWKVRSLPWRELARWTLALALFGAIGAGAFWLGDRLQDIQLFRSGIQLFDTISFFTL